MWEYKGLVLLIFVSGSVSHQSLINDSDVAFLHFIPMIMELHASLLVSYMNMHLPIAFYCGMKVHCYQHNYFRTFPVESCTFNCCTMFFVCFNISINELHKYALCINYCSLLWYTGI